MSDSTRLTCTKCGFDGYFNPEFGHTCMKYISLAQWEAKEAECKAMREAIGPLMALSEKIACAEIGSTEWAEATLAREEVLKRIKEGKC